LITSKSLSFMADLVIVIGILASNGWIQ